MATVWRHWQLRHKQQHNNKYEGIAINGKSTSISVVHRNGLVQKSISMHVIHLQDASDASQNIPPPFFHYHYLQNVYQYFRMLIVTKHQLKNECAKLAFPGNDFYFDIVLVTKRDNCCIKSIATGILKQNLCNRIYFIFTHKYFYIFLSWEPFNVGIKSTSHTFMMISFCFCLCHCHPLQNWQQHTW